MERPKILAALAFIGAALLAAHYLSKPETPPAPAPAPVCPDCPDEPTPAPKPKPKPWGPRQELAVASCASGDACMGQSYGEPGKPVLGGKISPDGSEEIQVDLPASQKQKNVGGSDGAGLCVFTATEYCARWQNERRLFNFQSQMRGEPGGGHPDKVDQMIAKYAPGVKYLQSTTGDMAMLRSVLASGRACGVTYGGYDPHYGGYVSHMVMMAHCTQKWCAISDNNFPADDQHVWMSPGEFERRWKMGGGGWLVVLLNPPPPPPPVAN